MSKKVFLSRNYQVIIAYIFLSLPYLAAIGFTIRGMWWAMLIALAVSYLLYATIFHRYIRLILLAGGNIKAIPSLTPIDQIQYRVDVPLANIIVATYSFAQGDSKGNRMYHTWDIPCLRLKLQDNREETIMLCGYTRAQVDLLEKAIKKENQNITFTNNTKRIFIK